MMSCQNPSLFLCYGNFGGFGKEARLLIKKISKLHSDLATVPTRQNARTSLISRTLSILLQRGNALIQLTGAQFAREAAGAQCGYN